MMSNAMRGLTNFISDIRNTQNKEQEKKRVDKELAHIRERFLKEASMKGYDRKKYVSKLLYIQMLGYSFDFGHMEAVNLLSSVKYSEKQMGYLACALMLNEDDDIARLIINSIQKDLVSRNELWQCLALSIIGNLGGREMAETLHSIIEKLVVTAGSPHVRKRAAIALLRLYRKFPDIFAPEEWRDKVLKVLDERELGVVTSTLTLVTGLIGQSGTAGYEEAVPKCVRLLKKLVIEKEADSHYVYYGVLAPWAVTKSLRLLQFFPQPEGSARDDLREVITKILNTTEGAKNVNRNNAAHSILFEAVNLIIHYNSDREQMVSAASMLGRFLSAKEANIRYLGLEAMSRLATILEDTGEQMRKHQTTVFSALREPDISIRKQALNMLYGMCDRTNAQEVVSELLDYLNNAEYAIREELVLKIAILAEKFASDFSWYVDVMLVLIQQAGDFVAQDVWWRVVQIVTNNPELYSYASKTVYQALQQPIVGETMLKVAGYVLGEFGGAVTGEISTSQQFDALYSRFSTASMHARELLLTSFIKMAVRDGSVRGRVEEVLRASTDHIDAEQQQRAVEYLLLSQRAGTGLPAKVLERMPAFPERESSLVRIIKARHAQQTDKVPSEADQQASHEEAAAVEMPAMPQGGARAAAAPAQSASADLLGGGDLLGGSSTPAGPGGAAADLLASVLGGGYSMGGDQAVVNKDAYERLCMETEGSLYEDAALSVLLKSEFHGNLGRLVVMYANKAPQPLNEFRVVFPVNVNLKIQAGAVPSVLPPGQSVQQMISLECLQPYRDAPTLQLSYTAAGQSRQQTLRLPVHITKFVEPFRTPGPDFFKRWNQFMTGTSNEQQLTFKVARPVSAELTADIAQRLSKFKLAILEKLDPNPINLVAAGLLITSASQAHVLLRVEFAPQQQLARLTVRSASDVALQSIAEMYKTHLSY